MRMQPANWPRLNKEMSYTLSDSNDLDDDNVENLISSNRARRDIALRAAKPRDKTLSDAVKDMIRDAAKADAQVDVFNPTFKGKLFEHNWLLESLGGFYYNHLIADILAQVKGGKEANVYCCSAHPQQGVELLAAKVYRPRMFRNLKNDAAYRAGGTIKGEDGKALLKKREMRAVQKRSKVGLEMLHNSWLQNEYATLNKLHAAGARVPKTYGVSSNAIIMDYLGERAIAASNLTSVTLEPREAQSLFDKVIDNIRIMLAEEVVHGDLSAYNILYWEGDFTIIDFPQATNPWKNPHARSFFDRDVTRVCEHFAQHGVKADARRLAESLWNKAYGARGNELQESSR
jgi:RIO kinase 1